MDHWWFLSYYQEYLGKGLTEKYAVLNTHMEKVTNDANSAIANLQNRLSGQWSLLCLSEVFPYLTFLILQTCSEIKNSSTRKTKNLSRCIEKSAKSSLKWRIFTTSSRAVLWDRKCRLPPPIQSPTLWIRFLVHGMSQCSPRVSISLCSIRYRHRRLASIITTQPTRMEWNSFIRISGAAVVVLRVLTEGSIPQQCHRRIVQRRVLGTVSIVHIMFLAPSVNLSISNASSSRDTPTPNTSSGAFTYV